MPPPLGTEREGFVARAVPLAGVFVCWLLSSVPVTALLPTPPPSLAAIAVAAPIISNEAMLRIRIVFFIDCAC